MHTITTLRRIFGAGNVRKNDADDVERGDFVIFLPENERVIYLHANGHFEVWDAAGYPTGEGTLQMRKPSAAARRHRG